MSKVGCDNTTRSESTTDDQWQKKEPIPLKNKFTLLSCKSHTFLAVTNEKGIHQYDGVHDTFSKIYNYGRQSHHMQHAQVSIIGTQNQIIYSSIAKNVESYKHKLIQFNLKTKSSKIIATFKKSWCKIIQMICVGSNIHIILKTNNNILNHCIFDTTNKTYKTKPLPKEFFNYSSHLNSNLLHFDLFYLKSRNILLLFGTISDICEYSLEKNEWIYCNPSPPAPYGNYEIIWAVLCHGEQYILLGTKSSRFSNTQYILVVDLVNQYTLKKSKIQSDISKCHNSYQTHQALQAAVTNVSVLLTHGYIRKCFNTSEFITVQTLPYYLIDFISNWVCMEYLHLVKNPNYWYETDNHMHVISVDKILK